MLLPNRPAARAHVGREPARLTSAVRLGTGGANPGGQMQGVVADPAVAPVTRQVSGRAAPAAVPSGPERGQPLAAAVAELPVLDASGRQVPFGALFRERRAVVVFVRVSAGSGAARGGTWPAGWGGGRPRTFGWGGGTPGPWKGPAPGSAVPLGLARPVLVHWRLPEREQLLASFNRNGKQPAEPSPFSPQTRRPEGVGAAPLHPPSGARPAFLHALGAAFLSVTRNEVLGLV